MADLHRQLGNFPTTSWRSDEYRQKVRSQLDQALKTATVHTTKTSYEMENHVFTKAKTRDEYLGLVARLIIHLRDNNAKKNKDGSGGPGMMNAIMDPAMAVLQNPAAMNKHVMAPNGHPQVMRPQMMGQHPGMHPGARGPPMGMQMGGPQMGGPQMGGPQMGGPPMSGPQMGGPQMGGPQMGGPQMGGPGGMGMPMQHQMGHMPQHMMGQRMPAEYMMQHGSSMSHPGHPGHPGHPANMQQHSPHQYHMAPSIEHFMPYAMGPRVAMGPTLGPRVVPPVGPPRPMSPEEIVLSSQLPQSSPVMVQQQSPAPISQLVPSPAMMTPSPQQQQHYQMAASPASRLQQNLEQQQHLQQQQGTPQTVDDMAYLEKLKQLSRFIDPLRRMIAQTEKIEGSNKESMKLHKLLDVLLNAGTRVPMAALLKCEQVLEKMNFDVKPRPSEQHMCMPLLEAVRQHLNSPTVNHTLHRTVAPALAQIHGPPLCTRPVPSRKRKLSVDDDSDEEPEIPDVLQGEVARLERKFKVTLDPAYVTSSSTVHVICRLEDKTLPHVPPIMIRIPRDYPRFSPECTSTGVSHGCTPFLRSVDEAFKRRLDRLPDNYSLTSILSAWELSIRQVCAP